MKTLVPSGTLILLLLSRLAVFAAEPAAGPLAPGVRAFEARRYEEARRFFEPFVKTHPRDGAAACWYGRTLFGLGRFDDAAEELERATELAPRHADCHFWLGRTYGRAAQRAGMLRGVGLAKDARAAFEQAVALDPEHLEARFYLMQFYLRAPAVMGGSVDKAGEQAAAIAQRDAVRGAIAQANVLLDQADATGAIRLLEEAVTKSEGDSRARLALGGVLQQEKRWDAAFEVYEAILAKDHDHWDALYQIGRTAALSGRHLERGEAALRRYVGHVPGPDSPAVAAAHYQLGIVLEKRGDKPGAKAAYQAALRLDPGLGDAKKALAKLG
jgi:tetratricopeptide (TPR) repeat protein